MVQMQLMYAPTEEFHRHAKKANPSETGPRHVPNKLAYLVSFWLYYVDVEIA